MSCLIMLWYSYYDMLCYVVVSDRRQSERIKSNQQIQKMIFWMKKNTFLSFFAKLNFPPFLLKCFTACSLATAPLAAVNVFFPCPTPKREQNTLEKSYKSWKTACCWAGKKQSTAARDLSLNYRQWSVWAKKGGVPNSKPFFTIYTFCQLILLYVAPLSGRCMEKNVYRCQGSCR